MHIFSDFNSFLYNLNPEQRLRFNTFLQSLKDDGMEVAYINHGYRRDDITIDYIMERSNQITEWEENRAKKELAASKGETTIPEDDWGVHRTHCCNKHGCKYGDPDCPVEINLLKQDYPCEVCSDEKDNEEFYRTYNK
jgi:hypothetical protein